MTRFAYLFALLTACTIEKNLTSGDDTTTADSATLGASSDSVLGTTGTTLDGSGATLDETSVAPLTTTDEEPSGGGLPTTTDVDPSGDDNTGGGVDAAALERTCAPNDGIALEFRLKREANACDAGPAEFDLVAVLYQDAPIAPGTYVLGPGIGHWEVRSGDMVAETHDTGTLIINAWDDDLVSGHYELSDENGGALPGFFELAPFCGGTPMCG